MSPDWPVFPFHCLVVNTSTLYSPSLVWKRACSSSCLHNLTTVCEEKILRSTLLSLWLFAWKLAMTSLLYCGRTGRGGGLNDWMAGPWLYEIRERILYNNAFMRESIQLVAWLSDFERSRVRVTCKSFVNTGLCPCTIWCCCCCWFCSLFGWFHCW